MKKKLLSLLVLVFSIVALAACGEVLVGEKGAKGDTGAAGKSAYDIAVENGFQGTVDQWLESLMGDRGPSGINGVKGSDGIDGKDAHEIRFFEEDGTMCWSYVPNEGDDPEDEMFDPQILYYTKDYITVSYYDGETLLNEEEVARKKVGSYSLWEAEDIPAGYEQTGWVDANGEEVDKIENHSIKLFLVVEYVGVKINVEYGLDANGQQIAEYNEGNAPAFLAEKFLAAVSEKAGSTVTGDGFYSALKDNILDILKQIPEWNWYIQFMLTKNPADNKRILGAAEDLGLTFEHQGSSSAVLDSYSKHFLANWIMNFVTGTKETVHDGSASSYPAIDCTSSTAYSGIISAFKEGDATLFAEFCAVPGNVVTGLSNINNLSVPTIEGAIFYLQGDETKAPVELEDMVAGSTYVYGIVK